MDVQSGASTTAAPIAAQACTRVPGRYVSRLFFIMTLSFTAVVAADASRDLRAQAPKATIVGPGAATCQRFNDDIKSNPLLRRDYLAWARVHEWNPVEQAARC
jgi:hypothetical protein